MKRVNWKMNVANHGEHGQLGGFPDVPKNQDSIADFFAVCLTFSESEFQKKNDRRKTWEAGTIGHVQHAFKIFGPFDTSHLLVTHGFVWYLVLSKKSLSTREDVVDGMGYRMFKPSKVLGPTGFNLL